jgi:metal-responsive CopG/Arc/MetJ family transcriptional regulator
MASVKVAISLDKPLFEQAELLARELKVTRSRLFTIALGDLIRRHQGQLLLERINAAYSDTPPPAEQALQRKMRRQHRQVVEGEW